LAEKQYAAVEGLSIGYKMLVPYFEQELEKMTPTCGSLAI
jgi:hypothetical protein